MTEMVLLEQFSWALPTNARNWVLHSEARTLDEAVRLMESYGKTESAPYAGKVETPEKQFGGSGVPQKTLQTAPQSLTMPTGRG